MKLICFMILGRSTMRTFTCLSLLFTTLLLATPSSYAQEDYGPVELHAEALAGGATVAFPAASEFSFGIDLSIGKHIGPDLTDVGEDVDIYGVSYAVVCWRPDRNLQFSLSPIGIAGIIGNDFGAFYPSARLGVGYFLDRWGVGTEFRMVRIAGGHGTGKYWLHWSPLRVSLRL